jgi:hypothetical protein
MTTKYGLFRKAVPTMEKWQQLGPFRQWDAMLYGRGTISTVCKFILMFSFSKFYI